MLRFLTFLTIVLLPALAFGQVDTTTTSTVAIDDLFASGKGIVDNWNTVGVLGSVIAIVNLLVRATKWGPIGRLVKKHELTWLRPLLAATLGGLGGAAGAIGNNGSVLQSVLVGVMAGLGSVGAHQLYDQIKNRKSGAAAAIVLLCFVPMIDGCGASYQAAVELYVSSLPQRGARYYNALEPELRRELILNDAALACLVDQENDRVPSLACVCTQDPVNWEKSCAAWLGVE